MYWEDQSSEVSRQVIMDADRVLTADFDVIPFIVGWDFAVSEPRAIVRETITIRRIIPET